MQFCKLVDFTRPGRIVTFGAGLGECALVQFHINRAGFDFGQSSGRVIGLLAYVTQVVRTSDTSNSTRPRLFSTNSSSRSLIIILIGIFVRLAAAWRTGIF